MLKIALVLFTLSLTACNETLQDFVDVKPPLLDVPATLPGTPVAATSMKISPGAVINSGATIGATLHITPTEQKLTGSSLGFEGGLTKVSR